MELRRLTIVVPAAVLVACLVGLFLTRGVMANLPFLRGKASSSVFRANNDLVDQRPWQTIEALAPLAVSGDEKRHAREAQRLADHEVDQAFAQALRQASLDTRTLTGEALALQQKVAALQAVVKEDQAKVDSLTAASKVANPQGTDDLDIAKAQLQLDTDQLNEATEDLATASGDKRGQIQQELASREAAMKKFDEQGDITGPSSTQSAKRYSTLAGRISAWFNQRTRMDMIEQAQTQANSDAAALTAQHAEIEKKLNAANTANTETKNRVANLKQMHALAQIHSIVDDRIQTQKQLAIVYGRWLNQVKLQHQIVMHLILQSIAFIAFLLLCSSLIAAGIRKLLDRLHLDRRNLMTMRTIASLAVQIFTILFVLLVIFGAPSQLPTILGIATAGLTVVFQGFILAFFGWFILMGKNGIRVGDWVEIEGVSGEVIEIGLLKTVLLELGNWTETGHPTGRRVAFSNSFALEGHYFNFSTSNQWLWDELQLPLPATGDPYEMTRQIREIVERATEADAAAAAKEWERVTRQYGAHEFTAAPAVNLRPSGSGLDAVVRYITRAPRRNIVKAELYEALVDLLHKPASAGAVVR